MYFLTIQNGTNRSKSYQSPYTSVLMRKLFETLPVGRGEYRIISSGLVFRIEIMIDPRYTATFTNIPRSRQNGICEQIVHQLDLDGREFSDTASLTDVESSEIF